MEQDQARIRIELLGKGSGKRAPIQSPLLTFLATEHPRRVSRDEILAALYPDSEPAAGRNRLRVGLTRLRGSIPLREVEETVGLDPTRVSVDLCDLKDQLRDLAFEPSAEMEIESLKALLPSLSEVLFVQATEDWRLRAQADWSQSASAALDRLGNLAEEALDNATAAASAQAMLNHFPFQVQPWERYLRAMARMGLSAEAERKLALARKQAKAEGWPWPEELEQWVVEGEYQDGLGPELSSGENLALERFFRRTMLSQPELAVEILGSTSFRPEVLRAPKAVLPLLREALNLHVGHCEARERIQVRVITALSIMEETAEVLKAAEEFLSLPIAPARRRITLLSKSFAHATLCDLDAAMGAIEEAMTLTSGPTAESDLFECRAQRATFLMFGGKLEQAEAELREVVSFFDSHPVDGAETDVLAIRGNLGLNLLHQGRIDEATHILLHVVDTSRAMRQDNLLGLFAPVLGLALAEREGGIHPCLGEGLRAAYRTSASRAITAASYVGRALMASHAELDGGVLREAYGHRLGLDRPLNWLEQATFQPVLADPPAIKRPLLDFVRATLRRIAKLS